MAEIDEKAIEEKLTKDPSGATLTKEETQYVMGQPNITDGDEQSDPEANDIPDSEFSNVDDEEPDKEDTSASEKKDDKTDSPEKGKEEKPEELKLTPFQWCEALGANPTDIKDPDGWRHRNIQFHTPLTRDEFLECASESTISLGRNSVLCYAIKQWENNRNR